MNEEQFQYNKLIRRACKSCVDSLKYAKPFMVHEQVSAYNKKIDDARKEFERSNPNISEQDRRDILEIFELAKFDYSKSERG